MYREDGIHLRGFRVLLVSVQGGRYSFEGVRVLLVSVQGGRYLFEGLEYC